MISKCQCCQLKSPPQETATQPDANWSDGQISCCRQFLGACEICLHLRITLFGLSKADMTYPTGSGEEN